LTCTTSSQETEWVYSYNPGARTGLQLVKSSTQLESQRCELMKKTPANGVSSPTLRLTHACMSSDNISVVLE